MRHVFSSLLILALCAGLWACSRQDEPQARFDQAYQTEQSGNLDKAQKLYQQLLVAYPDAPAAQQARGQLERIVQLQKAQREAAFAAVESLQKVVESYQLVYRRWPQSLQDFDDGDYLFDSDYMAESVNEGFTAYLALADKKAGYRIWSFSRDAETGYLLDGTGRRLEAVSRGEAMAEIERIYLLEEQKGALTFLVPNN